jgi:hypothetical protein
MNSSLTLLKVKQVASGLTGPLKWQRSSVAVVDWDLGDVTHENLFNNLNDAEEQVRVAHGRMSDWFQYCTA